MSLTRRLLNSVIVTASLGVGDSAAAAEPRASGNGRAALPAEHTVAEQALLDLPMRFEPETPGPDGPRAFRARGPRYEIVLDRGGLALGLRAPHVDAPDVIRLRFKGANPAPQALGEEWLPGVQHYIVGARNEWRTDVPGYRRVRYRDVYPGIDVVFYGTGHDVEFDFLLRPGADPTRISMAFEGAAVSLDEGGDVLLSLPGGTIRQRTPVTYQDIDGARQPVPARYRIDDDGAVRLDVDAYDIAFELVIDPVIAYSTYLGDSRFDGAVDVAIDADGYAYVVGTTSSRSFPTKNAIQTQLAAANSTDPPTDLFITKLTPSGSALVFSTYLGGKQQEGAASIALGPDGAIWVAGTSTSPEFPTTENGHDRICGDGTILSFPLGACRQDGVLVKLSADGSSLLYSTFFGGSNNDSVFDLAVDAAGMLYVLGHTVSSNFPFVTAPFATGGSYYLARIDPTIPGGAAVTYSVRLGPAEFMSLAVDDQGMAYLFGHSGSSYPIRNGYQTARGRGPFGATRDTLLVKLDTRLAGPDALLYSTYFGGNGTDTAEGLAYARDGVVFVVGSAGSSDLQTRNGFQETFGGGARDAFVTVFDTEAIGDDSLLYSTYLGGTNNDDGRAIALDPSGAAYIAGRTFSTDFPLVAPFQAAPNQFNVFIAKLNPAVSGAGSLVYSSFFSGNNQTGVQGIAVDSLGNAVIVGDTSSTNLPMVGAIQPTNRGGHADAFIAKISEARTDYRVSAIHPTAGGNGGQVTATIYGRGFVSGASVLLRREGHAVLVGESSTLVRDGVLTARFDLAGAAPGDWDVVVRNPDRSEAALPAGFAVRSGATLQATASLVGRSTQRLGRATTLYVTYANPGNVDILLPIYIYLPKDKTLIFDFPLQHRSFVPFEQPVDYSPLPIEFETDTHKVVPMVVYVPAGSTGVIPITIPEGCTENQALEIRISTGSPMRPNDAGACMASFTSIAFGLLPGSACVTGALELAAKATLHYTMQPASMSSWIADSLLAAAECAIDLTPAGKIAQVVKSAALATSVIATGNDFFEGVQPCTLTAPRPGHKIARDVSCVVSVDPNEKSGPPGSGAGRHIQGTGTLSYGVSFENLDTATAAAQEVVITDTLDPSRFDLATFAFGPVIFGDRIVTPPAGLQAFVEDVDLRPAHNLILRIDGKLDRTTGVATWRFTSLDPETMQLTDDPLAGFLPPNQTPPAGEGTVFFTIEAAPGLGTGDGLRNDASIVFDVNAPIITNEWLNTIDRTTPSSMVAPLAARQFDETFQVTWSGQDIGAGVAAYSIYVSENGTPFTPWLQDVATTNAAFTGVRGHTYAFFSVARDLAGNEEALKLNADAITEVLLDVTPPLTTAAVSPEPNAAGWHRADVMVLLSATDDLSGVREIRYTAHGATNIAETVVPAREASIAVVNEGVTELVFYAIDHAGNVATPKSIVVQLDRTPPVLDGARAPLANAFGWNNTDVTASFSCTDAVSGVEPGSVTADTTLMAEGENQSVAGACRDLAGNEASTTVVNIHIDKTPPVVIGSRAPEANAFEWNNTDVTASFTCSDALSGVEPGSVTPDTTLTAEGANQSVAGGCRDRAGNAGATTVSGINIDKTPPTVTCAPTPTVLWPPNHRMIDIAVAVAVTDALAGPDGFTLRSAASNEPDLGVGDGNFPNDIQDWTIGTPDIRGRLRAERAGGGTGRLYTLGYEGRDRAGNMGTCAALVSVPHDRRR